MDRQLKIENNDSLVNDNIRLVESVAKEYQHQGLDMDELVDAGIKGLKKADEHFDETSGFKFLPYAEWWIRQSIIQAIFEK